MNTTYAQSLLTYAFSTISGAALERTLTLALLATLAEAGKALDRGRDATPQILHLIRMVEKEEKNGRIAADKAQWILEWLYYVRDVIVCPDVAIPWDEPRGESLVPSP